MRFLVVGAGATGGYFGGLLADAGRDVTFLVRPARAVVLRRDGLRIRSPHGDRRITPKLVEAIAPGGAYDCVLVSVKAPGLDDAADAFAPAVGPDTMILPVQNGLRHVDTLVARFGAHTVIGGLARIHATLDAEGCIVQGTTLHDLVFGERDGTRSPRIEALAHAMTGAGFDAALSENIEQDMWDKWILLASLGGINCLLGGTIGEIAAAGGAGISAGLIGEIVAIASAASHAPSDRYRAAVTRMLTEPGSAMTSSMYRDMRSGRPTEVEQILGDLFERKPASAKAVLLEAALARLRVHEQRLSHKV